MDLFLIFSKIVVKILKRNNFTLRHLEASRILQLISNLKAKNDFSER